MSGLKVRRERRRLSLLTFKSFHCRLNSLAFGGIFTDLVRAVADGDCLVKMLIDYDAGAIERAAPGLFVDLQDHIFEFDGVVAVNGPLGLDREDAIQIRAGARDES